MKKLNYGFIGCGMMGQEHINNIKLFKNIEIRIIYEPNILMQRKCKQLLPNVLIVYSEEEVINSSLIDAIIICTPNYLHADLIQKISSIRQIPLLIEKPVCTSINQVKTLKKISKIYSKPIWVGMEYRYMPPIIKFIQKLNDNSVLGDLITLSIKEHRFPFLKKVDNWNRFNKNTGGTLVEKCCHFFDLICHIFKKNPIRIYASGGQELNHLDEIYNGRVPDILDNAMVIIDFESGQRASLNLCMFAEGSLFQTSIDAIGSKAKIECQLPGPIRFWPKNIKKKTSFT